MGKILLKYSVDEDDFFSEIGNMLASHQKEIKNINSINEKLVSLAFDERLVKNKKGVIQSNLLIREIENNIKLLYKLIDRLDECQTILTQYRDYLEKGSSEKENKEEKTSD